MKEKLIELAEKIKDKKLREKTIQLLNEPELTNPSFAKHQKEDIENVRVPFSVGGVIVYREVVKHTIAVTELCMRIADVVEEIYGIKVNRDYLIAGALLHDIMKVFEWREGARSDILLDHTFLGAAELYKRDFPEEVIHLVASHLGESTTPPRTIEAVILHMADSLCALIESYWPQVSEK